MIESRLGGECKKFGVYSLLLNNLACTFEVTQRYEEACMFYAKAVMAHRTAEDYQAEEQRCVCVFVCLCVCVFVCLFV